MKNKNQEKLNNFVEYCAAHPEMRFWQALRNWAEVPAVYVSSKSFEDFSGDHQVDFQDTFYWE